MKSLIHGRGKGTSNIFIDRCLFHITNTTDLSEEQALSIYNSYWSIISEAMGRHELVIEISDYCIFKLTRRPPQRSGILIHKGYKDTMVPEHYHYYATWCPKLWDLIDKKFNDRVFLTTEETLRFVEGVLPNEGHLHDAKRRSLNGVRRKYYRPPTPLEIDQLLMIESTSNRWYL